MKRAALKKLGLVSVGVMTLFLTVFVAVYAAQNAVTPTDKKQLGLFSGNGDFVGTVLDVSLNEQNSTVRYSAYNSQIDAIVNINSDTDTTSIVVPSLQVLYFDSINCTGIHFVDNLMGFAYFSILPQVLSDGYEFGYFVATTTQTSPLLSKSSIDLGAPRQCVNQDVLISEAKLLKSVTLPFSLQMPYKVVPL